MGEVIKNPDFFPRRINQYVPAMQYAADVQLGSGIYTASLGSPAVVDTDGLLDGVDTTAETGSITVTGNANLGEIGATSDAKFGRNVTVTGAGSGAKVLTINGYDYLGQPMSETITCSSGDGTGKKAFYEVTSIDLGAEAGDNDSDFGWGALLGLPYKSTNLLAQRQAGATVAISSGSIVTAVLTDPQIATSGDPRGTFDSQDITLAGNEITITAIANAFVNSDGNGGLHGIAHYSA